MRHFIFCLLAIPTFATSWITEQSAGEAFPLVTAQEAATWVLSPDDAPVVELTAANVVTDLAHITGTAPAMLTARDFGANVPRLAVLCGTLGHHPMIDQLVTAGTLDIGDLRGAWESFLITIVEQPFPGMDRALVIVGSDRRGTAYGAYELAQEAGVSPWHWWADVIPEPRDRLYVSVGTRRFGPPSVKYRGIFLNDEDWGLQPWAAHTFEPENGDIGPKTYAKVFELLLRLKANTLWPAMHACTAPFNADPRNAALANDYAIVMGSSHAEPLLRNNVGEWTAPKPDYNYVTNREGVRAYWEERLETNGSYENLYTLGMRGIHDSGIQGTTSDAQRIEVLEQVFADQHALIAEHVDADVTAVPQIFTAYKEVLALYRQGLSVPDDVTIVWPDDNFGFVRNFADPAERDRAGGFGVYYHLSYLGRPMAYLWLNTTAPALIWEEMAKSHAYGADQVWIVNVGDLKPAEIGTEFFLNLAWDIGRWNPDTMQEFLPAWAEREFGPELAPGLANLMDRYYAFNSVRKPEHLQWWMPLKEEPKPSDLSARELSLRRMGASRLRGSLESLAPKVPAARQDAFFQLVAYPVLGSVLASERYFAGERGDADTARAADEALHDLNARFDAIAHGKWRGFMRLEPADDDWRSMRIAEWEMPPFTRDLTHEQVEVPSLDLNLASEIPAADTDWHLIPGLGHTGAAVTIWPFTPMREVTFTIRFYVPAVTDHAARRWTLRLHRLPTHPIDPDLGQPVTITLDDGRTFTLDATTPDGSDAWAQGVLNQRLTHEIELGPLAPGRRTLSVTATPGLVIDDLVLRHRNGPAVD